MSSCRVFLKASAAAGGMLAIPNLDASLKAIERPHRPASRDTLDAAHASLYYGALKARADQEVETHYPGINTIIRPYLIVGPLDRTDRFTY